MYTWVNPTLKQRRKLAKKEWNGFLHGVLHQPVVTMGREISESWVRSHQYLSSAKTANAPLADADETRFLWHESPIRVAAQRELGQLMEMVSVCNCVAAIADTRGQLLWTYASPHMETRAADENFITGGNWGEQNKGTNAIGLSLAVRKPVTVFSAEHYSESLHEWVCYAAPILHPQTDEILGVIDLSSTWEQYNPMGQAAVHGMAQSIAQRLMKENANVQPPVDLEIRLLGGAKLFYKQRPMHLSLRHCEILCVLALHPEGMTLNALHAAVYGDSPTSKNTLKSEISTLRSLFQGCIASRPYRLTLSYRADFIELWSALKQQQLARSVRLYRGSLLAESNSPEIEQWRYCIDAAMDRSMRGCDNFNTLLQQCEAGTGEIVRERLLELAGSDAETKRI